MISFSDNYGRCYFFCTTPKSEEAYSTACTGRTSIQENINKFWNSAQNPFKLIQSVKKFDAKLLYIDREDELDFIFDNFKNPSNVPYFRIGLAFNGTFLINTGIYLSYFC